MFQASQGYFYALLQIMSNKAKYRSSSHSLKFMNAEKQLTLSDVIYEYRRVAQYLIDLVWLDLDINSSKINTPKFIDAKYTNLLDTWLSARMKQCIGKQVLGMLQAATKKQQKRYYQLKKLQNQGKPTQHLQRKIDKTKLVKPDASNINMELDSRFIDFQQGNHFDIFIRFKSIGQKLQIKIPVKHTKVSRKWQEQGEITKSIRISENTLNLLYKIKSKANKGKATVAIDQGSTTVCTLSDGQVTGKCPHGHDLKSIQQKLARSKKGSKGFKKAQEHRKNHIGWSINQLNFSGVKTLRVEKLHDVGRGQSRGRFLSHWTYTLINDKLKSVAEMQGIELIEVDNKYRSQRCNNCAFVHKLNRSSEKFCCRNCSHETNADSNASLNLLEDLAEIPYAVFEDKLNHKAGFFWFKDKLVCQEGIVLDMLKG